MFVEQRVTSRPAMHDKCTFSVDDIDLQSVIDSWRYRCRKTCK